MRILSIAHITAKVGRIREVCAKTLTSIYHGPQRRLQPRVKNMEFCILGKRGMEKKSINLKERRKNKIK